MKESCRRRCGYQVSEEDTAQSMQSEANASKMVYLSVYLSLSISLCLSLSLYLSLSLSLSLSLAHTPSLIPSFFHPLSSSLFPLCGWDLLQLLLTTRVLRSLSLSLSHTRTQWGSGRRAQPCISVLTSRDRTSWANNRLTLLCSSPTNAAAIAVVENALFGVTLLDHPVPSASGHAAEKGVCHVTHI